MAWLSPVLGAVGSIWGDIQQQNQDKAMDAASQQAMSNASNTQNQELQGIQGMQQMAGNYTNLIPGLAGIMGQEQNGAGAQAPGAASQYMGNAMSPSALAATTGINAGGITQNAVNYLSDPNATNLSGANSGLMSFYGNEMANGLNPQTQSNAQNQLNQQYQQSNNQIQSNLAPGQNASAMQQAAQNNLLQGSTNLAGNLAGENQQTMQQGAAGVSGTAQAMDAQRQQMLTGASSLANQYNQTVLGDQAAGASFGQNVLGQLQNFTNTGNQMDQFSTSALGALGGQQLQEGEYYGGLASGAPQSNMFSSLSNILAQNSSMFGGIPGGTGPTMQGYGAQNNNQDANGNFIPDPSNSPFGQ